MNQYFKKNIQYYWAYLHCVPISCWASVKFALSIQPVIDSILNLEKASFWRASYSCFFWGGVDVVMLLVINSIKFYLIKQGKISLKQEMCHSILNMNYHYYAKQNKDYLSILNNDTQTISDCDFSSRLMLYRVIWSFALSLITVTMLSPMITILILLVGGMSVLVPHLLGAKIDREQLLFSQQKEQYFSSVKDMFDGILTIKTALSESFFEKKHNEKNKNVENQSCKVNCMMYFATWFSMLCSSAAYVLTLVVGGLLVFRGYITAGYIISISQLIGGIVAPLEQIPAILTQIRSVKSICQKCEDILKPQFNPPLQKSDKEKLVCECVSFFYKDTKNGINQFNYEFEAGKKYLITGLSGGGKSTIGKLIAGLYACNEGNIKYPNSFNEKKDILYVTQQSHIFQETLRNNLTLGDSFSDKEILETLDRCSLTDFVSKLPHGLDETLGEQYFCSGGEAARISLARAILRKPKILILDEITANLDSQTSEQINELVSSLTDTLLLTISHELNEKFVKKYESILLIKNGSLVESGNMEELMKRKGEFYQLIYKEEE